MKAICHCIVLTLMVNAGADGRANWNSAIAESNPLNWYRFNERAGSTAVDYGSEHRNGTYGSGPLDATREVDGLVGVAAQFGNHTLFKN